MWLNVGQSLMIILLTFFLPETKGVKLIDKISEDNPADHVEALGLLKTKENAIGATELLEQDTESNK
jgi:response regulator of citrate/malate metabolism